jgi:hypothetical protein
MPAIADALTQTKMLPKTRDNKHFPHVTLSYIVLIIALVFLANKFCLQVSRGNNGVGAGVLLIAFSLNHFLSI